MEFFLAAVAALGLGIQTSISPCPLATNIAAISYVARRAGSPRHVLLAGTLYALGRTLVYVVLGMLMVGATLSPRISWLLRRHMDEILGPPLILVAMFLLGMLQSDVSGRGMSQRAQKRVDALGIWGALVLGIALALSFCPVSAGLFFVALASLAIQFDSSVVLPSLYGIGTALPVLAFAAIITISAQSLSKAFNRVRQIEGWARQITGGLFLAIGIHYSLKYDFGIAPFWDAWLHAITP
jgi:cytochrome c-type biogenesis protein